MLIQINDLLYEFGASHRIQNTHSAILKQDYMKARINPFIVLAIGMTATSLASTLIRFAQGAGAPSLIIAAFRLSVAAVAMGIAVTSQGNWHQYRGLSRQSITLIVLSGLFLGGHFSFWITSLELTSVTNAVVLVKTNPIWVGIFAPLVLKEKTNRMMWLSIGLVIFGATVVSLAGQANTNLGAQSSLLGDGMALIGALLVTGYFLIGRFVRTEMDIFPYLFGVYGVAAITVVLICTGLQLPLASLSRAALLWMLAIGIIPQLIGHSSINYAMRYINAAVVTNITLADAIPAIIFAGIFLREVPTLLQLAGASIVIFGIFVATYTNNQRLQTSAKPSTAPSE